MLAGYHPTAGSGSEGFCWSRGRIALALAYMDYGVEMPDFDSQCWITYGQLQMYAERFAQALSSFEYALVLDSNSNDAVILAGWCAQNSGEFDKALKYYRAALARTPERKAEILNNIGQIQMTLEDYQEAEDSFKQSLEVKPEFHEAAINLAILYRKTSRIEQGEAELNEVISSLEKDPQKSALLANVRELQAQWRRNPENE